MRILFLCSGNICRSPFAEVLARELNDRVDVGFSSAGTSAIDGTPATATAVAVAAELGIDMGSHRAALLTAEALESIDLVYGMEQRHLIPVLALDPALRAEVLRPDGAGISDPYGGDRDEYRHCYSLIRDALERRIEEWE